LEGKGEKDERVSKLVFFAIGHGYSKEGQVCQAATSGRVGIGYNSSVILPGASLYAYQITLDRQVGF
jgi:hypothetical protein